MAKLNQVVANEKGTKARTHQRVTDAYQKLQKTPLLTGQSRTYQPLHEEGVPLPPENQRVQVKTNEVLGEVQRHLAELFDVTATKDWANCTARANIVVDGMTLVEGVPATYLLFLEKQLVDLNTVVSRLPTLDPSDEWEYDANTGTYKTGVTKTLRTQKVPRNHVKAEATERHPAQVEVYHEDVPVGEWSTRKFSGAVPGDRVRELSDRVHKLQAAVKSAREEANMSDAPPVTVGETILGYVFA